MNEFDKLPPEEQPNPFMRAGNLNGEAKAEQPAPAMNEQPASTMSEQPAPAMNGQPAPTMTEQPAPTMTEQPAPAMNGQPAPAMNGQPAPAMNGQPAPAMNGQPAPAMNGQPAPAGGEYEVSFDSASGKYTFTDHTANTGMFTQPEKPKAADKQPKHSRTITALMLTLTVLVSALLGAGGGILGTYYLSNGTFFQLGTSNKQNNANGQNGSAQLNAGVQQTTVTYVNDGEVNYGSIAAAAAKCYDSVVVIETYLSEAYAEAGEASGAGSGVIWTADGYIVTCNHVIDGANVIRVSLTDGSTYYADVVGTDTQTDLAVLKVQATELLPVTSRGSALVLGETAIAIGNPLGVLANSVSEGILSSLAREITVEGQSMSLLQTTAAVNSGNSGGGLFDINGSLIGIVNAKSTGDTIEGLGYAIPIETVMTVCNQLIEQGFVSGRPQLGITVVSVTQMNYTSVFANDAYPELKEYATKTSRDLWGREYMQVVPGTYIYDTSLVVGYADGSDSLKFGDLLLYVGNTEINSTTDVKTALNGYNAGDTIQLTVLRGQRETIIINLILGQLGSN